MFPTSAIRVIRIHFTGLRLWYHISAPPPLTRRVVAGEALRRFRAAQEHPVLTGDQGKVSVNTPLAADSEVTELPVSTTVNSSRRPAL